MRLIAFWSVEEIFMRRAVRYNGSGKMQAWRWRFGWESPQRSGV